MSEPRIPIEEYRDRITELAKEGIRKNVVHKDRLVETDELHLVTDALTQFNEPDAIDELVDDHPHAILEYTHNDADEWWPDAHDLVSGQSPVEAAREIQRRVVKREIRLRAEELLDGQWDAIKTREVEREVTVTETETYFDPEEY